MITWFWLFKSGYKDEKALELKTRKVPKFLLFPSPRN